MTFELDRCLEILDRTPTVLSHLVGELPEAWTGRNEGPGTWSAYDVVGHLVHGERADWTVRMEQILSDDPVRRFEPFDRFAQFEESRGKSLSDLLEEFQTLRAANLVLVRRKALSSADMDRTGVHPEFGDVTLRHLIATWTAHDLDHLVQISRVMAHQISDDVGPWKTYLRIVRDPVSAE